MAIKEIGEFEKYNDISVNVVGIEEKEIYICRKSKYGDRKNVVNLFLIADGDCKNDQSFSDKNTVNKEYICLMLESSACHPHVIIYAIVNMCWTGF